MATYNLETTKKIFGQKLKKIRKSRDIQQLDIQEKYPISRFTVARLEKGEGSLQSFFIYLNALGLTELFIENLFKDYTSPEELIKKMNAIYKK